MILIIYFFIYLYFFLNTNMLWNGLIKAGDKVRKSHNKFKYFYRITEFFKEFFKVQSPFFYTPPSLLHWLLKKLFALFNLNYKFCSAGKKMEKM